MSTNSKKPKRQLKQNYYIQECYFDNLSNNFQTGDAVTIYGTTKNLRALTIIVKNPKGNIVTVNQVMPKRQDRIGKFRKQILRLPSFDQLLNEKMSKRFPKGRYTIQLSQVSGTDDDHVLEFYFGKTRVPNRGF